MYSKQTHFKTLKLQTTDFIKLMPGVVAATGGGDGDGGEAAPRGPLRTTEHREQESKVDHCSRPWRQSRGAGEGS